MRTIAAGISALTLISAFALSSSPTLANEDSLHQASTYSTEEQDRLDELYEAGEKVDPLALVPNATTDPKKIEEITESGKPSTVVIDVDTGEVVAARADSLLSAQKITNSGPGCSASGGTFCLFGKTYYGFNGTGTLSGSWKSISGYSNGNKQGRVKFKGKWRAWGPKWRTTMFNEKVTVTGIARE